MRELGEQNTEIIKPYKLSPNKRSPGKKTVYQGGYQRINNNDRNNKKTWEYKKQNPQRLYLVFLKHGFLTIELNKAGIVKQKDFRKLISEVPCNQTIVSNLPSEWCKVGCNPLLYAISNLCRCLLPGGHCL